MGACSEPISWDGSDRRRGLVRLRHRVSTFLWFALAVELALGWLPTAAQAQRSHTVRSGQTLAAIARRHRVSVADLKAANHLRNARLRPGQSLIIPERGTTYVRRGETLSHIARRANASVEELRRANRLRRNARIRPGQRLVLPGHTPREQLQRDYGDPETPGRVTLIRRERREVMQLVDDRGRVRQEGLDTLKELLKRTDQDQPPPANPRLGLLLARISDRFGGRPIRIVSGYRPARGRTRESSRHVSGRATDIRVQGVPHRAVWEFCRRINHAGCGFYPRSTFVHVDARLSRTQWVDWSRPGQGARYGDLRGPTRRRRRLRMSRPRVEQDLPLAVRVIAANEEREFVDSAGLDGAATDDEAEAWSDIDLPQAVTAVVSRLVGLPWLAWNPELDTELALDVAIDKDAAREESIEDGAD